MTSTLKGPRKAAPGKQAVVRRSPAIPNGGGLVLSRGNPPADGLIVGGERQFPPNALADGGFEVIVSGAQKGVGSSREQAATALKYFGIPCVIGGSASQGLLSFWEKQQQ